ATMLKNAKIYVIDADELARRVQAPGMPAFFEMVGRFGVDVLKPDGSLDRAKLANIVFNDSSALSDLENIVHPKIEQLRLEEMARLEKEGHEVVVYMAPLLFEKQLHKKLDKTILIVAKEEVLIERMAKRDGFSQEEAKRRLALQMSNEEKMAYADEIIENSGTIDELFNQLQIVWKRLCNVLLVLPS
ncbi:MAG TPA: dephospho-CoA kinase, partial [Myxococcota bacterium]|nr:dephospho-CoA kinase [Myxococcota bacterium]